jgi:hypothetical protein
MKQPRSPLVWRAALFAISLGVFAGVYLLWAGGHERAYLGLLRVWGIDAWDDPFLDLAGVLSWSECHRLGVDVFRTNPCDPLHRLFNYGPPLLVLPFSVRDTMWLGIGQVLAFLAVLPFVLRPRDAEQWAVALAATMSTATLFAVERANLDILEFLLIAAAGWLMMRGRCGRYGAYALYYAGGISKFYPFALLLQILRERPKIAAALAIAAVAAIGIYAAAIRQDLALIKANLPPFFYNCDTFGAFVLPYGLAAEWNIPLLGPCLAIVLYGAFGVLAFVLSRRLMRSGLRLDGTRRNSHFLVTGAILMTACFATQTSLDYRAIFFLFMLAGLFDLRNAANEADLRWVFRLTIWGVLFCLWGEFFRRTLDQVWHDATLPPLVFFAGRELVWWSVVAVAAAIVLVFVETSPLGQRLTRPGHHAA